MRLGLSGGFSWLLSVCIAASCVLEDGRMSVVPTPTDSVSRVCVALDTFFGGPCSFSSLEVLTFDLFLLFFLALWLVVGCSSSEELSDEEEVLDSLVLSFLHMA